MQQNIAFIAESINNNQEKAGSFICPIDNMQIKSVSTFTHHLKYLHIDNMPEGQTYPCSLCIATKITEKNLVLNSSMMIDWNAVPEEMKFKTNNLLAKHKKEYHPEIYPVTKSTRSKKRKISRPDKKNNVHDTEIPHYVKALSSLELNVFDRVVANYTNQIPAATGLLCELCSQTFTHLEQWNSHFEKHVKIPSHGEEITHFCTLCAHDELCVMCLNGSLLEEKVDIAELRNTFNTDKNDHMEVHYKTHTQQRHNHAIFSQMLALEAAKKKHSLRTRSQTIDSSGMTHNGLNSEIENHQPYQPLSADQLHALFYPVQTDLL